MLFNSIDFAIFLPIVFFLYWFVTYKSLRIQNILLLIASYIFYGWWDWRFLSLMFFSSLIDFIVAIKLDKTEHLKKRKFLLLVSLVVNLGMLGFFKYYNFFVDSFVNAFTFFGMPIQGRTLNIILPVGISFYTFQTLSYTIDVYRKQLKATKDAICFFAFVSFFPQLVAGPIERAIDLLPQFYKKRTFDYTRALSGLRLMVWGFFKKIVIADRLAQYVDVIYNNPDQYHGITIIVATIFFAFQIYCDFSAYSDIALGTARLFGFELMVNFRTPYFSTSIREFWSRWHISLSTWFRDYVYIPLGGNRVSTGKWIRNLMLTFIISGLWHGANITFVIWGFIHGVVNSIESVLARRKSHSFHLPPFAGGILTFSIVCFAWIFFRAKNMSDALTIINNIPVNILDQLSSWQNFTNAILVMVSSTKDFNYFLISFILFISIDYFIGKRDVDKIISNFSRPVRWSIYYTLVIWIVLFGAFDAAPQFIYFQF